MLSQTLFRNCLFFLEVKASPYILVTALSEEAPLCTKDTTSLEGFRESREKRELRAASHQR